MRILPNIFARSVPITLLLTLAAGLPALLCPGAIDRAGAQITKPTILDPDLSVRQVVGSLVTPICLAFMGNRDILVLEKNTGQVKRFVNGTIMTVADLAVNFASERGLLGIALHPNFPSNPSVYLYWTESTTGADTSVFAETPLLGNRVDRFVWNGSTLVFAQNIIRLRALQPDAGQVPRGNHNGGVLRFGPDKKLYILVGDVGRRGQLQNLPCGPTATCPGPIVQDDQFGGPAPDNAHLTGVVLRLNDDGTAPSDNPFFSAGAAIGGESGANIQKIFAYGIRNGFGMAFDPISDLLWTQENGDDSFDEINLVMPGFNSGWIQIMGPAKKIKQYKEIETSAEFGGLQQLRWPPSNIADSASEAKSSLFVLPGSHYSDPELSWKFSVAPGGIGFVKGRGLGVQFRGDLFVGAATTRAAGGYLFRFKLTADRKALALSHALEDRVANNTTKYDLSESRRFLIGEDFGVTTDIQTGPNGNLFVVSLSHGAIYEIRKR
jgi:glucose/arabinose dehydrogenase